MNRPMRVVVSIVVSICLVACSTAQVVAKGADAPATLSAPGHAGLRAGDDVQVQTRDGTRLLLEIVSLDAEALVGKSHAGNSTSITRVAWSDVDRLERVPDADNAQAARTAGLVIAVILVAAALGALLATGASDGIAVGGK